MPVIGRLDEQVDERIISPISNRRRDEEQSSERQRDEETPATSTQTPSEGESSAKTDELPVWLL
ncbi:MAG: hypothetical protein DMF67_18580 [Acidobacteria bacterium]|nr:MAG: hypothetical protein DMF66_14545 [Acidobacteriota bacterium]PYS81000.1 MAG: hypothetical protein DMF67_18580 [Acidobacteriota bacterium]